MDINSQEHIKTIAPVVAKAYQLGKEQKYDEAYQLTVRALKNGGTSYPLLAAQQHWLAINK